MPASRGASSARRGAPGRQRASSGVQKGARKVPGSTPAAATAGAGSATNTPMSLTSEEAVLSQGELGQAAAALCVLRHIGLDAVEVLARRAGTYLEASDLVGGPGHLMAYEDQDLLQEIAGSLSPTQLHWNAQLSGAPASAGGDEKPPPPERASSDALPDSVPLALPDGRPATAELGFLEYPDAVAEAAPVRIARAEHTFMSQVVRRATGVDLRLGDVAWEETLEVGILLLGGPPQLLLQVRREAAAVRDGHGMPLGRVSELTRVCAPLSDLPGNDRHVFRQLLALAVGLPVTMPRGGPAVGHQMVDGVQHPVEVGRGMQVVQVHGITADMAETEQKALAVKVIEEGARLRGLRCITEDDGLLLLFPSSPNPDDVLAIYYRIRTGALTSSGRQPGAQPAGGSA